MVTESSTTPKTDIPFNFGRASNHDSILFTCERPGGDPEGSSKIVANPVQLDYMKGQGIQHVLILLDDNEMDVYEDPGLVQAYDSAGFITHRQPMGEEGASENILSIIQRCELSGERIAAHCTHGMGRSGRVAAGWIATRYQRSPEEATKEAMSYAKENGIERLGNPDKLTIWLSNNAEKAATPFKLEWRIFYDLQCSFSKRMWDKTDALIERFKDRFHITRHLTSLAYHRQAFAGHAAAYCIGANVSPEARRDFEKAVFQQQHLIMDDAVGMDISKAALNEIYADIAESCGVFSENFTREYFLGILQDKPTVIKPAWKEVRIALGYGAFGAPAHVVAGKLLLGTESSWEPEDWDSFVQKMVFHKD